MEENFSFGYWLRRQRLARDLRQADLAQQLGVAPITLRKIEADERRPSLQLIARIAELFALGEEERMTLLQVARADLSPAALPLPERALGTELNEAPSNTPALALPSGTLTFLFTDIEGSTQLWEQQPAAMRAALAQHDGLLRAAIARHNGVVIKATGDGVLAAFALAKDGLAAAIAAQLAFQAADWSPIGELRVRMALHSGAAELQDGDYVGPTLNRAARLLAAGHGGQILLSGSAAELLHDSLPTSVTLRDLGSYRLKDLTRPEQILQVVAADLPADFPPLRTLNARQHNLPAQASALVGREREVEELSALLRQADVRLVTLIGPGGTGKTRLALQAAAELSEQFAHGVWFVNLAPVSDPALVLPTIAQTLDIRELSGLTLVETLHAALREQQVLLLLDNFEQVVTAAPELTTLLAHASQLKMLVTSREALHLSGEWLVAVPPLTLPDSHLLGTAGTELALLIAHYEAVQLFVDRARAVRADFSVTSANALVVAAICARLDGLPLAIELAAARLRLLSPEALLARLERRLQLLTGGPRDRPARQQTLRGAIAWSYDLLGPAEQRLFRRLGVFVGGCPIAAIELMEGDGASELDALEGIASLVDKSLLRQEDGPEGEPRFLMLETIREYALEQLQAGGEQEEAREQHAAFFRELALLAEPELRGPRQYVWLKLLDVEHDNLRAALRWLSTRGDAGALASMCAGLWRFWWVRTDWREGRTWLEQALAGLVHEGAAVGDETIQLRGALMQALGWMHYGLSDFAQAQECFAESLTLAQSRGDWQAQGGALQGLGSVGYGRSDYGRAVDTLSDALAAYQEVGDQFGITTTLAERSGLHYIQGDLDAAFADQREALTLARAAGLRGEVAVALETLSNIHTNRREFEAALRAVRESLALRRELGDRHGVSSCLNSLGELSYAMGQYDQAAVYWAEALELRRVIGYRRGTVAMLVCLGRAVLGEGDLRGAARWNVESIAEAQSMEYSQGYHWCLLLGACIASRAGAVGAAAQLIGAMDALAAAFGFRIWPENQAEYDEVVAAARSALGAQAFTTMWELGCRLPLDTALAMASQPVSTDEELSHSPLD